MPAVAGGGAPAAGGAMASGGFGRAAHGGVELAGGRAHAAPGADQLQLGRRHLGLDAQHVGLRHGAGFTAGLRQGEMTFRAREIPFRHAEQVLRGGERVEGRLHRQAHVAAGGGGVRLGAAEPGAGGVEAGAALAEIEQRHLRGQAAGPVVERADDFRDGAIPAG